MSSFRDLVKDEEPVFVLLATVALHDGEKSHWYRTAEGHIAITVKTHRHGVPIDAILPTLLGNVRGIFGIPEIGTEVALGFEGGDMEDDAFILAVYGGVIPTQLDPDHENRIAIVGTEVHVIAPNGTGQSLMTKADGQAISNYLKKQFDSATGHKHSVSGTATVTITEGTAPTGTNTVPDPAGTDVLMGQ